MLAACDAQARRLSVNVVPLDRMPGVATAAQASRMHVVYGARARTMVLPASPCAHPWPLPPATPCNAGEL